MDNRDTKDTEDTKDNDIKDGTTELAVLSGNGRCCPWRP